MTYGPYTIMGLQQDIIYGANFRVHFVFEELPFCQGPQACGTVKLSNSAHTHIYIYAIYAYVYMYVDICTRIYIYTSVYL